MSHIEVDNFREKGCRDMSQLEQAIRLRQEGKTQEAIELLHTMAEKEPGNANVWYQLAWAHDSLGLEREAVPYYETALSQGLKGKTEQEPFWVSAVHIGPWVSMSRLRSGWKREWKNIRNSENLKSSMPWYSTIPGSMRKP